MNYPFMYVLNHYFTSVAPVTLPSFSNLNVALRSSLAKYTLPSTVSSSFFLPFLNSPSKTS